MKKLGCLLLVILAALAVGGCFSMFNRPPVADFRIIYNQDPADPLVVVFDASLSTDPDGDETIEYYLWDFGDRDVQTISCQVATGRFTEEVITVRYPVEDEYTARLAVQDDIGKISLTVKKTFTLPMEEAGPTQ